MISVVSTGCIRQDYLMFEDGDFDGVEFSDYDLIQNAELEMDDIDRNWRRLITCQRFAVVFTPWKSVLKIFNRAVPYDA